MRRHETKYFSNNDEDLDNDESAPVVNFQQLIGGPGNYQCPVAQPSTTVDVKPGVSTANSILNGTRGNDLAYFPHEPALAASASRQPPSSVQNHSGLNAVCSSSRDVKPNLTPIDVKPSFARPPFNGGVREDCDDDDDVVVESFLEGRLRGGHDTGTEFRRFDKERAEPAIVGNAADNQVSNDNIRQSGSNAEDSDEDLIMEEPTDNNFIETDTCRYCDIRILNKAHWERHKETPAHKTNEQAFEDEEPGEAQNGFYYDNDDKDDEDRYDDDGNITDPMIDVRNVQQNGIKLVCGLCDKYMTSIEAYNAHLNGAKHNRKKKMNEATDKRNALIAANAIQPPPPDRTSELENELFQHPEPHVGMHLIHEFKFSKTVRFNCQLCSTASLTRENLGNHIRSNQHRRAFLMEYSPSSLENLNRSLDETGQLCEAARRIARTVVVKEPGINRMEGVLSEDYKLFVQKKKDQMKIGSPSSSACGGLKFWSDPGSIDWRDDRSSRSSDADSRDEGRGRDPHGR